MNENRKRTVQKLSRYVWRYRHSMYTEHVTAAMKHRRHWSQKAVELPSTQKKKHTQPFFISIVFFHQTTRKCYVTMKLSSPKHTVRLSTGNTVQRATHKSRELIGTV